MIASWPQNGLGLSLGHKPRLFALTQFVDQLVV